MSTSIPQLPIGYLTLLDLQLVLDKTQPVYLASHVDTRGGSLPGQRIDKHTVIVTQPDTQNRVHYWRLVVAELVYHNGIAFAPDAEVQVERVVQVRGDVEARLVGEGCRVVAGMVALPVGLQWAEGTFK